MVGKKKTYRVNKVATEFNVSWKTIIEHLTEKGFEVESKITAKLDESMYQDLLSFYQKDKLAKEESQQLEINIRKDAQTQAIKETKKQEPPKPEVAPEPTIFIKDTTLGSKKTEEEKPEPPVKEPEVPVEKPTSNTPPETEKSSLKVVGKIDIKKPTKPVKKTTPIPEDKPPKQTVKKEESETQEEIKEVVETEYKKLEGTKVLGKVEIKPPVKRTKTPPKGKDEPKKKRKRIRGEKVTADKFRSDRQNRAGGNPNKTEVSEKEIQDKIKKTLAQMSSGKQTPSHGGKVRQKARKFRREEHKKKWEEKQLQDIIESKILDVTEFVTANDLSNMMDVSVNEIIGACFSLGMMVSINQRLDAETIQIVAEEFGYEINFVDADETIEIEDEQDNPEDLKPRHPIVTVMGHVDHGKTSLLDHIRKANVIAGEAGGITQHVAAYEVKLKSGDRMTFIDTPGHEAFTAMRARGAQVTDIAIIVIAADDAVMPQTKEAISHAQAANVPIVFAFNKIDKDGANPDKVREALSAMNILVEVWGGKFQTAEISAKNGINIDELLEKVSLEAEMLELKANPDKNAKGGVLEAKIEKGRGVVASMLVQEGTLRVGDALVAGQHYARIKAMFNERGQNVKEAGPASPISILGFSAAPAAGETFQVMVDESTAKEIANKREQLQREQDIRST